MTEIKYHEAAEEELLNAAGYLELQTKGLGRRFLMEVRKAEGLIAQLPLAAAEVRPGIRKRLLRKFRYPLIYSVEEDHVLILAVAHTSRRPGYWSGRIGNVDEETKGDV